jgi:hypothetical protein
MKSVLITALTTLILLFGFSFLFKDEISTVILKANCTKLRFYEFEFNICEQSAQTHLQTEKDSISNLITALDAKFVESRNLNKQLIKKLKKCNKNTADADSIQVINQRQINIIQDYEVLSPKIDLYKKGLSLGNRSH